MNESERNNFATKIDAILAASDYVNIEDIYPSLIMLLREIRDSIKSTENSKTEIK